MGVNYSIKGFYQNYLGININLCSDEEYVQIANSDEFKSMPVWPDKDSVRVINNVAVIKYMEEPYMP